MTQHFTPIRLTVGAKVRIAGRSYHVSGTTDVGRIFVCTATGEERVISMSAQITMMRELRLTSEASFIALDRNAQLALEMDWGAFSEGERLGAFRRFQFVKAIDGLPMHRRDKAVHVRPLLAHVHQTAALKFDEIPTFRAARKWYIRWIAGNRDARVLVDHHRKKGNRTPRYPAWIYHEIQAAIDDAYATDPAGSKAAAQERAQDRILLRAKADNLTLPTGPREIIGKNIASRHIGNRDQFELACVRYGRREANRMFDMVGVGPQGSRPLGDVETDHTLVDVILVDAFGRILGRPYLTCLVDRYSRMILGFALSFQAPSWISVLDALTMSVLPKSKVIERICGDRELPASAWDVFGPPDNLFVDRGAEFQSGSMRAAEAMLNMRIIDLPPRSPHLKGTQERLFGVFNTKVFHRIPGTTYSNVAQRRRNHHDAEGQACMTLDELRYIVLTWIVDSYNQTVHPTTGQTPAERWRRGMEEWGPKPAPPPEVLRPLSGITSARKLRADGVRFEKMRWNSNEFQALRARSGGGDVMLRVDPFELSKAFVLDEEVGVWIEGDLVEGDPDGSSSLAERRQLRKARRDAETFDPDAALMRARAHQRIRDVVDAKRKSSGKKPEVLRVHGRKPVEHVRSDGLDPEASAAPFGFHDLAVPPDRPPQDARGPYREPSPNHPAQPAVEDASRPGDAGFSISRRRV